MLKMKTNDPIDEIEEVAIVNFRSSLFENLKTYDWGCDDPLTGKPARLYSYIPKPEDLDVEQAILLLEELQCHLQLHVPIKNIPRNTEQGRLRMNQHKQTVMLMGHVRKYLKTCLQEEYDTSLLTMEHRFFNGTLLKGIDPEDCILHWYCNGCFPEGLDDHSLKKIRAKLEEDLANIKKQMDAEPKDDDSQEREKFLELCDFRCDLKRQQLDRIAELEKKYQCLYDDKNGSENLWTDNDSCTKNVKQIVSTYKPQWLSMPELVDQIEKLMFYKESGEQYSGLEAMHDELLQELNQRIEGILRNRGVLRDESVKDHENRSNIRFLTAFLDGSELEHADEFICCWYLNECFPHYINVQQIILVEKELKRQLAILDAEEERYSDNKESALWLLRYHLRERQLDEIQEKRFKRETALENWGTLIEMLDEI